jgi:hypothetical protein
MTEDPTSSPSSEPDTDVEPNTKIQDQPSAGPDFVPTRSTDRYAEAQAPVSTGLEAAVAGDGHANPNAPGLPRKTVVLMAIVAIVCLLLGGGAVALYNQLSQGTTASETPGNETPSNSIPVPKPWVSLDAGSLPDAGVNQPYKAYLNVGASGPMKLYCELMDSHLPTGLSLDPTEGSISGTPTQEGLFSFSVHVFNPGGEAEDTQTFWLAVGKGGSYDADKPWVDLKSGLPDAGVNQPYKAYFTLGASWEMRLVFELVDGALPPGLALNPGEGFISGTATQEGMFSFDIRVYNPGGEAEDTKTIWLLVGEGGPVNPDIAWIELHGGTLEDGHVGQGYSQAITYGMSWPMNLIFEVTDGTLPPGIEITDGMLSGVPTVAGDYKFKLRGSTLEGDVEDSAIYQIKINK